MSLVTVTVESAIAARVAVSIKAAARDARVAAKRLAANVQGGLDYLDLGVAPSVADNGRLVEEYAAAVASLSQLRTLGRTLSLDTDHVSSLIRDDHGDRFLYVLEDGTEVDA